MLDLFVMIGTSFALSICLMFLLWIIFCFVRKAALAELGWIAAFVLTTWVYLFIGNGHWLKKTVIVVMATIWGGRLFVHLCKRFKESAANWRYRELLQAWGNENIEFKYLLLFVFQGSLVPILSLPILIVCHCSLNTWGWCEGLGIWIWSMGVLGETIADLQLEKFKKDPKNINEICHEGLWRYSRHPNYFFEWLVWTGYFVFGLGTAWGILGIVSPALMLVFLYKVSGIPLSETHALQTKGQAYQDYQKSTNAFVPWFPKQKQ